MHRAPVAYERDPQMPVATTLLMTLACAPQHHVAQPLDALDWDLTPGAVGHEVRVAPIIVAAEAPTPDLTGIVGEQLLDEQAAARLHRTSQLAELPHSVHEAVPGQLHTALPDSWNGYFRDTRLSLAEQVRLTHAVRGEEPLTDALSEIALGVEGEAVLFTWVIENEGTPLTDDHMVGELVFRGGVPVLVDHHSEPYVIRTEIGVALVSTDGELLFRYQDTYDGLLVEDRSAKSLGRDLARDLVADIAPLWLDGGGVSAPVLAEAR